EWTKVFNSGESLEAAVVTIPASFDTIQSNATKEAGYQAGFEEVKLLQEPIAASLAYANKDDSGGFESGQWLVYDLGGGTFDVALVRIQDGEMTVLDHEGNNFLGGTDFDQEIVEKIIVPHLESQGSFENLLDEMRSAQGKYNSLYYKLIYLAEEAKLQLSTAQSADIEFETRDDTGAELDIYFSLQRQDFEALLAPYIQGTIDMMSSILERNQLSADDLKFVLMVGGSTYIPYVRETVEQELKIAVNTQIDPTTAVAVGAAYYAGTQRRKKKKTGSIRKPKGAPGLDANMAYQKATQEESEYFTARFKGNISGLFYRITRLDGGFDTGLKPLIEQIKEYLPLLKDAFNQFSLKVYTETNEEIETGLDLIEITQGRYSVVGQPLPQDICLEIDDVENETTMLEVVFEKNSILPLRRTLIKQMSKTIAKGSDERLTISIVEAPRTSFPASAQPIGFITVSGHELNRDLVRGSDIEITLEMSESRDLSINVYLMMTDQEYEDVFTPSQRRVNIPRLADELLVMAETIRLEISEAELNDNFEAAQELVDLEYEILELADKVKAMKADDVTDEKFQIEDRKRKIAQKVDDITRDKFIIRIKSEYFDTKRRLEFVMENYTVQETDQQSFQDWMGQEKEILATNSSLKIRELIDGLTNLSWRIRWKDSSYIKSIFQAMVMGAYGPFTNPLEAEKIIQRGQQAINDNNDELLRISINQLSDLLPPAKRKQVGLGGTGIG
ncbi:MAG: Hsp70 family protein, partial [Bacteroidota bacterium]